MADRTTTPYYQQFEQLKHQFCQWVFVERYTLVSVTEKFNRLFEEMSKLNGFRVRVEYENWVTRKRKWDKEWQIGQSKGLSGDTGPATEVLVELDDLPLWWVGDQRIIDLATGQLLFKPPPLLERYESRASGNGNIREHKKGADRTKQSRDILPSSKLEPAPSFYDTPGDDPMTLSTFRNTRSFEAQDIARDVYCSEEKDHGPDDHSTTPVRGPRGYGNSHWHMDPSLAVANTSYSYHGFSNPREELCGLSTAQAQYFQSAPQQTMREEENTNDDSSVFFLQGVPEMD